MTSTAALVAGWGRSQRRGSTLPPNIPGPMAPAGNIYAGDANAGPIGLTVEIYLGGMGWVDISTYCYYRDRVKITRGRPNETATVPPQTGMLTLNNRDGRFSPKNPTGPYFGLIGRNTPVRISRYQNGIKRYRLYGEIPAWPTTWDISGTDVYVPITAAGMLRRIQQGTTPLGSTMYRAYALHTSPTLTPVAYWPCEDGASATSFASGISGAPAMVFAGAPTLASDSAFACSAPIPVLNGSTWIGTVPTATWTDNVARFLMHVPTGGDADGSVIARMTTLGTVKTLDLIYRSAFSGELQLKAYDAAGNTLADTGVFGFAVDGQLLRVSMGLRAVGANIQVEMGTLAPGAPTAGVTGVTLNSATVGAVNTVSINPGETLTSTSIGHVSVQPVSDSLFDLASPLNAWNGENPSIRLMRLCGEQGIPAVIANIPNSMGGNTVTMGQQASDTLPTLIQQITDTDLAPFYEARDQLSLVYRSRLTLYNQGTAYNSRPVLTLDAAQNQFSAPLNPVDDDAYTRNDVTVSRTGGSSSVATLTSGSMSTQAPPSGVGDYPYSYSLSLGDDGQLPDQAGWRLHLGTVDEPRYPQISLNLRHPQFTGNVDLLNAALGLDIGDRIVINNPPPWLPPDPISLIVQGYSETLGIFEHDMVINTSPESPYRIAMGDDPVLCRADTDGSTLAAPLGPILNPNPFFTGGSSAGWAPTNCSFSVVGTSGSSSPLPAAGPTGYGVLVVPNGAGGPSIAESGQLFPVAPSQAYFASALFYYPSGLQPIIVGMAWFDASQTFISTSSGFTSATAATWTALSSGSLTSPSNAAFGAPFAALGNVPTAGDSFYAANIVAWQGAMSVASTNTALPLWTTSASDFPFDVWVGGERMTVTNITGGASPQAFTVARAVNTVAKPQSAGTDVRLYQPMILSL